jgi:hypothetical protein
MQVSFDVTAASGNSCRIHLSLIPTLKCADADSDIELIKRAGGLLFHATMRNMAIGAVDVAIGKESFSFTTPRQFGRWVSDFLEQRGVNLLGSKCARK